MAYTNLKDIITETRTGSTTSIIEPRSEGRLSVVIWECSSHVVDKTFTITLNGITLATTIETGTSIIYNTSSILPLQEGDVLVVSDDTGIDVDVQIIIGK